MHLSFSAVLVPLAIGAAAAAAAADDDVEISTITEFATICEISSTLATGTASLPTITVSNGVTYSISRPLITSTVIHCEDCSKPNPSGSMFVSFSNPAPSKPIVTPIGSAAPPSGSVSSPAAPLATGGASVAAAGAGAGLAAVFALAAYLL